MSLINLISNVESLKYEDNYGITAEQIKAYKAGVDDALEQIHHDLPRPEILAFAEAMEKMIMECPELKDWKAIDTEALKEILYDHMFYNLVEEDDVNADSYVHLAGFAWMLWWKAKDELDKQD